MPTIHPKDENPYILDAESAAEMTRLLQQDQLLTKGMGALLPAQIDPAQIHDVLDIGCGPGGWVRDVAFTYPEMEVKATSRTQPPGPQPITSTSCICAGSICAGSNPPIPFVINWSWCNKRVISAALSASRMYGFSSFGWMVGIEMAPFRSQD